jgi:hypothetical protein
MPERKVRPKAKAKRKARQAEIAQLMDPKAQRKLEREAENHLIDLEERAEERYQWALALKKLQPDEIQVGINRMTDVMARMAGPPRFAYQGTAMNVDGGEQRLRSLQYKNQLWIAMRLFVAAAEWGIRIGDFKTPKDACLRCGEPVKSARPRKKAA